MQLDPALLADSIERANLGQHLEIRLARSIERSEEHTSELQSRLHLVCRLLLEKKKQHHHGRRFTPATSVNLLRRLRRHRPLYHIPRPLECVAGYHSETAAAESCVGSCASALIP